MRTGLSVVLALFALACGSGPAAAAGLGGALSYSRVGGLAGMVERLSIQSDYRAKLTTGAGTRHFRLSRAERSRLTSALTHADLAHVKVEQGPPVSDAFMYTLRYQGHSLEFNQTNVPARVKPLVSALGRLVSAHGLK